MSEKPDKFYYRSGLGEMKGERSEAEARIESAARMRYAREILPELEKIFEELGVGDYIGYIRIDGSTTLGAAVKGSDIDFVAVAKGGIPSFGEEWEALFLAAAKVPGLFEEKTGISPQFPFHIHLETLKDTRSDLAA